MLDKFVNSMVRQVGRDLGKVVSNQVFGNAHSTPIRHVNRIANTSSYPSHGTKSADRRRKTDFEKSLNFKMTYTPPTLLNKLAGALIELKNEARTLIEDGYLSSGETQYFLSLLKDFNDKIADVITALNLHNKTKPEDEERLLKIINESNDLVKDIASSGYDGCLDEINTINNRISRINTDELANQNLLWAGAFVISLIAGFFIMKGWVLFPIALFGAMFWNSWQELSKANSQLNRLKNRKRNEIITRDTLEDLLKSNVFAARRVD